MQISLRGDDAGIQSVVNLLESYYEDVVAAGVQAGVYGAALTNT